MTCVVRLRAVSSSSSEPGPESSRPSFAGAGAAESTLVGECLAIQDGRVQVQICDRDGSPRACWARSLAGVDARPLDRLLLVKPGNADELVVAGVLSSPNRARPANVIALQDGQSVLVQSSAGQSLLELSLHASGPVVKLLSDGVAVHLPGELSISAQSIALQARQGDVSIDAAEDVVVAGTTIRLN